MEPKTFEEQCNGLRCGMTVGNGMADRVKHKNVCLGVDLQAPLPEPDPSWDCGYETVSYSYNPDDGAIKINDTELYLTEGMMLFFEQAFAQHRYRRLVQPNKEAVNEPQV